MKRIVTCSWAGFIIFLCLAAFPAPASARGGYRIVNVVDDFLAYYQAAKDQSEEQRAALWVSLVEAEHQAFFDDAVYRRKKGAERERYREHCLNTFWRKIAPDMDYYAGLNKNLKAALEGTLADFRKHFPDFQPNTDFYLTFSFSFRGKAVDVGQQVVMALGLEFFKESGPQAERQIRITLAHELFHLYHFRFFSPGGGLYRPLWAEGLAVYASAVVVPGYKMSAYLGFPGWKMNRCREMLPQLAADLKKNMGQNDYRLQRVYFGAEQNNTEVPPEAGYYVGVLIIQNLARSRNLAQLARMDKDRVFKLLAGELDRLAKQ